MGRALLARQWQRAKAIARRVGTPDAPRTIKLGARAWERQTSAVAVFEAAGMRRTRVYWQKQRELGDPLPAGPVPAQLRLESGMDRRVDEDVWRAYDEAFADH